MFLLAFSSLLDFGDFLGWERLGLLAETFPYNAAQWESTWNWNQPMRSLDLHLTANEAPTRYLTTTGDWVIFCSKVYVKGRRSNKWPPRWQISTICGSYFLLPSFDGKSTVRDSSILQFDFTVRFYKLVLKLTN